MLDKELNGTANQKLIIKARGMVEGEVTSCEIFDSQTREVMRGIFARRTEPNKDELTIVVPGVTVREDLLKIRCSIPTLNKYSQFIPFHFIPSASIIDPHLYNDGQQKVTIVGSSFRENLKCKWTDLKTLQEHIFSCVVEEPSYGDVAFCKVPPFTHSLELRVSNDGIHWSSNSVVYKHAQLVSQEVQENERNQKIADWFNSIYYTVAIVFVFALLIYIYCKISSRKVVKEKLKKN